MSLSADYRQQIIDLTKALPNDQIKQLIDFARFLKTKKDAFSYSQVEDSAEYVGSLRRKEGKRTKSGKKFIDDLIEWQRSNF
jgi:RNA polymerase-interacting CarD/CdnL/TRCF family regulator